MSAGKTIFVINGNSSESVTAVIDEAIAPLRTDGGPPIACLTLAEGPPVIQSARDSALVVPPLLKRAAALEDEAAAFVIACFSDPGLYPLREQSKRPVFGISECGVFAALTLGQRFGAIAPRRSSIPRHLRFFRAMGVEDRLAGEMSLDLGLNDLLDPNASLARMIEIGQTLRDHHFADVLLLAGAPLARSRLALEQAIGIPVVDPNQAGVAMAIARVLAARAIPAAMGREPLPASSSN